MEKSLCMWLEFESINAEIEHAAFEYMIKGLGCILKTPDFQSHATLINTFKKNWNVQEIKKRVIVEIENMKNDLIHIYKNLDLYTGDHDIYNTCIQKVLYNNLTYKCIFSKLLNTHDNIPINYYANENNVNNDNNTSNKNDNNASNNNDNNNNTTTDINEMVKKINNICKDKNEKLKYIYGWWIQELMYRLYNIYMCDYSVYTPHISLVYADEDTLSLNKRKFISNLLNVDNYDNYEINENEKNEKNEKNENDDYIYISPDEKMGKSEINQIVNLKKKYQKHFKNLKIKAKSIAIVEVVLGPPDMCKDWVVVDRIFL